MFSTSVTCSWLHAWKSYCAIPENSETWSVQACGTKCFKFEKCFAYNPKRTYLDTCCLFTSYPVQDTMFSLAQPNYCFLLHDHPSWSNHLPIPLSLEALGLNLKASHRSTNTGMGRVCLKRILPVRKMTGWFGTLQVSKPSNVKSMLSFADAVILASPQTPTRNLW